MIPQPYLQAEDAYTENHSNTALFAVLLYKTIGFPSFCQGSTSIYFQVANHPVKSPTKLNQHKSVYRYQSEGRSITSGLHIIIPRCATVSWRTQIRLAPLGSGYPPSASYGEPGAPCLGSAVGQKLVESWIHPDVDQLSGAVLKSIVAKKCLLTTPSPYRAAPRSYPAGKGLPPALLQLRVLELGGRCGWD